MAVDTILHNARIATNRVPAFVEAVAITAGIITATGTDEEILRLRGPMTTVIDGNRRTVIPGLNDLEIPAILQAAAEAGARGAGWQMLRLPWAVRPIFEDWLARNRPQQRDRIVARIQAVRVGKMNDYEFGRRMRGEGKYADNIAQTFQVFSHKFGLDRGLPPLDTSQFRPPRSPDGQKTLF